MVEFVGHRPLSRQFYLTFLYRQTTSRHSEESAQLLLHLISDLEHRAGLPSHRFKSVVGLASRPTGQRGLIEGEQGGWRLHADLTQRGPGPVDDRNGLAPAATASARSAAGMARARAASASPSLPTCPLREVLRRPRPRQRHNIGDWRLCAKSHSVLTGACTQSSGLADVVTFLPR